MSLPRLGILTKNSALLLLSLAIAFGLYYLTTEPSFDYPQRYVLFLLFFAMALWVTEAIPPFAVGLFIMVFLVFALGNPRFNPEPQDVKQYVNTFSSSVIWLMLGGFFLAEAMTKTKLDVALLRFTLNLSGASPRYILLGLMITTMFASMLMSNTATTAMVIASVMPLIKNLGKSASLTRALLVGVPLAAAMGGMGTIIGSPPNLIAAGVLDNAGFEVNFVQWMYYGIPLAIVLTSIGWLMLISLFLKDNEPVSLTFLQTNEPEPTSESKRMRIVTIIVVTVTMLMWMTSSLHNISVAGVSAIPIVFLTMARILDGNDVRKLSWDTLLLVAGGLSLGLALHETGLLNHYAKMIAVLPVSKIAFFIIFAYATMTFSNFMSNTAISTVLVPLGMAILLTSQWEIAMIIALSSSTALLLPVSTPPNAIAYATGMLDQKDFRLGGIMIGLLGPALVILWVLLMT
jgi:sodium-dependent dicarboxylate transporter 2/3/5